jgi:hypothetical protein
MRSPPVDGGSVPGERDWRALRSGDPAERGIVRCLVQDTDACLGGTALAEVVARVTQSASQGPATSGSWARSAVGNMGGPETRS